MANEAAVSNAILTAEGLVPYRGTTIGARLRKTGLLARQNPLGAIGFIIIFVFAVVALLSPWIAPFGLNDITAGNLEENPSMSHLFGTDRLGRDIFSRVVYGSRISLSVAFVSVIGGATVGTVVGIVSGYMGGFVDAMIQRTVDAMIAFPQLLLLLLIAIVLQPSFSTVVIAIMLGIIPGVTRVVRGAVLSERQNQYVEAARAIGASTPRILFRHLLPNVVALAIIIMTTLLGIAILAESSLAFLGLGIPEPSASWGRDVSEARTHFPQHLPSAFFPGVAITLTVLGFNLLGDAIRDIADPRLRGRL